MYKLVALLGLCIVVLARCSESNESEENPYLGTWELVEISQDRGDGVLFMTRSVDSEQIVVFGENEIVTSNSTFCSFTWDITPGMDGDTATYSIIDKRIYHETCLMHRQLNLENDTLWIVYFCAEACIEKYIEL